MIRFLQAALIVTAVIALGLKAYAWIERAEADRSEHRDQVVRTVAGDRAAGIERSLRDGAERRTGEVERAIEGMGQRVNLDSLFQR